LLQETRAAGDLIVELAQRASAYYAPSAAAAELVDAIHMDLKRIFSVSLVLDGQYGIEGVALSLPAVVGLEGIRRVLTPQLTPEETDLLVRSARQVEEMVEGRAA
jgi:malate dehydrogenase